MWSKKKMQEPQAKRKMKKQKPKYQALSMFSLNLRSQAHRRTQARHMQKQIRKSSKRNDRRKKTCFHKDIPFEICCAPPRHDTRKKIKTRRESKRKEVSSQAHCKISTSSTRARRLTCKDHHTNLVLHILSNHWSSSILGGKELRSLESTACMRKKPGSATRREPQIKDALAARKKHAHDEVSIWEQSKEPDNCWTTAASLRETSWQKSGSHQSKGHCIFSKTVQESVEQAMTEKRTSTSQHQEEVMKCEA